MTPLDCLWPLPPENLVLSSDEVHVWCASLDQSASQVQQLAETLCPDERKRAERFHFERDSKHFIVSRGLLRTILGGYLDIEPSQLEFRYGSRGKPALAETVGGSTLCFNLSHSHGLALYAIARVRELGIDLEHIRPLPDAEKIAQRFFSVREHTMICSLPTRKQHEAFFQCWTCKEAYLKATGDGLSGSLNQVDILLAPGEPVRLLSVAGNEQEASRWCLQQLMPVPGYMAALVVEGHGWRLACWQWSE